MIYFEIPWTDRKDQNNIRTRKKCYSRDVHSGSISCWTRMAWTEINTKKTDWERKKLLLGIRTFSRFVSQKKLFSRRSVTYTRTREAKWVEQQRKTVHEEENREKSKLLSLVETVIMQQDKHQGAPLADARHECDGSCRGGAVLVSRIPICEHQSKFFRQANLEQSIAKTTPKKWHQNLDVKL